MRLEISFKRRVGVSLVELLGVMAVIAILGSIAFGGIISAQEKARVTTAESAIASYENAFLTSCITNPGIVGDRYKIVEGGGTYNAREGLKRLVQSMNQTLDDSLDFVWDDSAGCYISAGDDPWGGKYILVNYPEAADGSVNYTDMSIPSNQTKMAASVWCTGNTDAVMTAKKVTEQCYGVGLLFTDGLGEGVYHGFDRQTPFSEYTLNFN